MNPIIWFFRWLSAGCDSDGIAPDRPKDPPYNAPSVQKIDALVNDGKVEEAKAKLPCDTEDTGGLG